MCPAFQLGNNMPNGDKKIFQKDMDLVTCEYDNCPFIGEYTVCYLGLEEKCMRYGEYIRKLEAGELDGRDDI